ncbi:MAG: Coenzyme F420 hydrogenase/dehydrogenase, beta subunit C-terminal domain [Candidatus Hydrothermarchaeota archaeon]
MVTAFVGLPCQIQALKKANIMLNKFKDTFSIGLFCRENWCYSCMRALVEGDHGIDLSSVKKFEIKGNSMLISYNREVIEIPLSESRPYVRLCCQVCLDFSSELSDVSVGSLGSPNGWSTLILRTDYGIKIVEGAKKEGYIEVRSIKDSGIRSIRNISREKKEESLKEAKVMEKSGINVPHILTKDDIDLEDFKYYSKDKNFSDLEFNVVDNGFCVSCGTCAAICPYDVLELPNERPRLLKACPSGCNLCYLACPRTSFQIPAIEEKIEFASRIRDEDLGYYAKILAARTKVSSIKGQDGGVVTSLLMYALDSGLIESAVTVTHGDMPWKPKATIVKNKIELLKTSGSIYSVSTTMQSLRDSFIK